MADQLDTIITEGDLKAVPIEACHKELIIRHFQRLRSILDEEDEAKIGTYTHKQAARESLARMTLVIRDYLAIPRLSPEDIERPEDFIESMVADVVDASFFVGGTQHSFSQPMFVNSQLWGREQEIATLMQDLTAGNADDVIELWNLVPERNNKVVPDSSKVEDIGGGVDWNHVLFRSRSEDDILHHRQDLRIEEKGLWEKALLERQLEELDLDWPPVFRDPEPNVGRQRRRTGTMSSAASRSSSVVASRRPSVVGSRRSSVAASRRPSFSKGQKLEVVYEPCFEAEEG